MHRGVVECCRACCGLISHLCERLSALQPISTLQDCYPTLAKDVGQCMPTQGLCAMPKVELANNGTFAPTYKRMKEEFCSTSTIEYELWICIDDIKRCVSGNNKKYTLDWPILPIRWPVKIGKNLSKEDVLALEDNWIPIASKEGIFTSLHAFNDYDPSHPSIAFSCATECGCTSTSIFSKTMC